MVDDVATVTPYHLQDNYPKLQSQAKHTGFPRQKKLHAGILARLPRVLVSQRVTLETTEVYPSPGHCFDQLCALCPERPDDPGPERGKGARSSHGTEQQKIGYNLGKIDKRREQLLERIYRKRNCRKN